MVARIAAGPVRVIHLVPEFAVGGMEVGITKLVNGADPAVVQGAVCSFTPVGDFKTRLTACIPLFEFNRQGAFDLRLVVQLAGLFRRERPDIVHTHAWGTLCEGYLAARLAGVPHVVHGEHGTMETRPRNVRVQRAVWGRLDRVLSVSERLADRMAMEIAFSRRRIQTIRNGLDLSGWLAGDRHATRTQLGLAASETLVVAIGRLVPVKNHAMLLDAMARVRSGGAPCKLAIVGDGPLRDSLRSRADALGLAGAVCLLGNRTDLPDLLAAADLFALSSDSEGMSNTIMEAMAAGRAVVATDVGGNSELVVAGETGLLTDGGSADSLAAAIGALAFDPARREAMAASGRRRAEQEFSVQRMLQEYQDMYADVVASRPLADGIADDSARSRP